MTWLVSIESRYQTGRTVFFALQPNATNQWWTVVLERAAFFTDKAKAEALVKKLKYNNPKVITLEQAQEAIAKWGVISYTQVLTKNNYDRQIPNQRRSVVPAPVYNRVRPSRQRQYDLFGPEYDHELNHLFGLDGWGSEGR